jgi:hypothetical protein
MVNNISLMKFNYFTVMIECNAENFILSVESVSKSLVIDTFVSNQTISKHEKIV